MSLLAFDACVTFVFCHRFLLLKKGVRISGTSIPSMFDSYLLLLSGYATPVAPLSAAYTLPPIRVL